MKSILIADDEYDIALALELVLSEEGYRVTTVANGKEALAKVAESRPDLIILDIMMPVLTGLETIKALKTSPTTRKIPVVLMSAAQPHGTREEYEWAAFVRKPFDVDRFIETIRILLEAAQN